MSVTAFTVPTVTHALSKDEALTEKISISNLDFYYGDHRALKNISVSLHQGKVTAFIGPSGCGKSTLLYLIGGFLPVEGGVIAVDGRPVAAPGPDRGVVFQHFALFPWKTVRGNILYGLERQGMPRAEREKRAQDFIDLVGLTGFEDSFPSHLSGGMKQRTAIARTLAFDPKILLMDEPFGALDALTREKMNLELLRIWQEAKKTIVFVTHGITEAVFLGTRVIVLTAGPARMADNFRVELAHPRSLEMKTSEVFGEYTRRIYRLLGME